MRILTTVLLQLWFCTLCAQTGHKTFHAYLYNQEYHVYLNIDFYKQNIEVPAHELYGPLPGFLGKEHNSFCWVITSCEVKSEKEAELQLINDYGSEDLKATLTLKNDSTYLLRQVSGSALKIPNNGKWQKLPKTVVFKSAKP